MKTLRTTMMIGIAAAGLAMGCRDSKPAQDRTFSDQPSSTSEPVVGKKIELPAAPENNGGTGGSGSAGIDSKCDSAFTDCSKTPALPQGHAKHP